MEAATLEEVQTTEAAAQIPAQRMFRYSAFVDVGEGAVACEHARDGACSDMEHFHAWIRLPNPYQHEDIRKKASAARARRLRELRDPDSDASVVLDEQLALLDGEPFRPVLVDELLAGDWPKQYIDADRELHEEEQWEHIDADREEFARLAATESDDAHSEDYTRLDKHLLAFAQAREERIEAKQAPRREDLNQRPVEDLVRQLRAARADQDATRAFVETFDAWLWFVSAFQVEPHPTFGRPHLPMWEDMGRRDRPSPGTMYGEAPEVIEELRRVFTDLQLALQQGSSSGN